MQEGVIQGITIVKIRDEISSPNLTKQPWTQINFNYAQKIQCNILPL